jgi:hypothetical protein
MRRERKGGREVEERGGGNRGGRDKGERERERERRGYREGVGVRV